MYGRETRGKEKDESAYSAIPSEGFAAIYSMAGLDYVDWAHHGTYVRAESNTNLSSSSK